MNDSDLIKWAETYEPKENTLQLSESTYITDLKKCLDSYVSTLKNTKGKPLYFSYRDYLLEIKRVIEEKGI